MLSTGACQTNSKDQILKTYKSQVAFRAVQTRIYEPNNHNQTVRTVIATLQDLGFVVDKADEQLGTVSATKLDGFSLRMTVTVRPRGPKQMVVHASGQYNLVSVSDAKPYQQFFNAMEQAIFLKTNKVN